MRRSVMQTEVIQMFSKNYADLSHLKAADRFVCRMNLMSEA